jgi:rhodanese-related sulfurtransferase
MKYINKNDVLTMLTIVAFAVIIAILYNFVRIDKLPFFKASIEELTIDDDELFGNIDTNKKKRQSNNNIINTNSDTMISDTNKIDTMLNAIKPNIEILDYAMLAKEAKKSSTGEFQVITLNQMQRIVSDTSGNFIIIDARRPNDYQKEHIENAINIFPDDAEEIVVEKIFALSDSKTIIVYCDGGNCDLSHHLGGYLKIFGYKFFIFEGGWEEWANLNNF